MSYQITLAGNRKAASRFVGAVRRRLLKALLDNPEVSQSDIADQLGVHRSVINRQLKGTNDLSLGRVAEIAWALGYRAKFELERPQPKPGANNASLVYEGWQRPASSISSAPRTVATINSDAIVEVSAS